MGKFVGNYIRELRERKGLSQADVAKMLSLKTAQSISNIERGVSPLPRAKIKRMADIFGVKKGELVTVVMREVQDRVARAAGVQSRSIVVGPEVSSEEFALLNDFVEKMRTGKASQRALMKKQLKRALDL